MDIGQYIENEIKKIVPMTAYTDFTLNTLNEHACRLTIPLTEKTKNHVQSLYFGALAVGADLACGMLALYFIHHSKKNIVLVFKDFTAKFLKRADTDVTFVCDDAELIKSLIQKAVESGTREEAQSKVMAYGEDGKTIFAEFTLTLSVKDKA